MENLLGELAFLVIRFVIHHLKKRLKYKEVLCLIKQFIRNEGEIKTFPVKQKLKEFITGRPAL